MPPPIPAPTPLELLDRLHKELRRRQRDLTMYADYYDGKHPLTYASPQFRGYWGGLFENFADNWCQVVVDSKCERLVIRGVRIGQKLADEETQKVWQANGLDADSGLAFVDAIAHGRAFALAWGNDTDIPDVTFESAHEAIVGYEPGSRRKRVAGLKNWIDLDAMTEHATLFTPDKVYRFKRSTTAARSYYTSPPLEGQGGYVAGPAWAATDLIEEFPNPIGEVPMVELPNRQRLSREPASEIHNVIPLQNAVNILWSHALTASEFAAFPQRVIMGMEIPTKPVVDASGTVVGKEPIDLQQFAVNRVLWLEDPDAKIGNWSAADLDNYGKIIEAVVGHIAAQTRTPQHYLIGKMANLSAEALKAAETGLVSTVREKQLYFGEGIREVCRLIALCQGDEGKAEAMRTASVIWKDPESRSDAELADSLGKLAVMLHVPDEILWRKYGFTDDEIREMHQMQADQQQRELELLTKTAQATASEPDEESEVDPADEPQAT